MVDKDRISVGVIGTGLIGRLHAEHLATRIPQTTLTAVCDVDLDAARSIARRFDVRQVSEDYRDLLADPSIDAVAIGTPRHTHARMIAEAAAAGKHIFCEKPLGSSLEEIDESLAAVAGAGVKLQVGFNRRFDATFRHVHDTVLAGGIGRPQILHIVSRDPELPPGQAVATAVDLFLETTVHDLDMARYLMSSEVDSVYAMGIPGPGPDHLDGALITLRFANGAIGTIDNHLRSAYGYDQRVEVFGSDGAISTANQTPHWATLSNREGVHRPLPLRFFAERYVDSYVAEMAAFAECILKDTVPLVTGADGRSAVALALAALQSLRANRPVSLNGIDRI